MIKTDLWIEEFNKKYKRYPRILHVGNIANNAYQNAKMLNAIGLECDVLSYDYYHAMGCPEWDDSDFTGDLGDLNFPRWNKVDLHGFKRPKWFVSGPERLCISYINAKQKGRKLRQIILWRMLSWARNDIARTEDYNNYTLRKIKKECSLFQCYITDCLMSIARCIIHIIKRVKPIVRILKKLRGSIKLKKRLKIKEKIDNSELMLTKIENDFKELFPDRTGIFGKETIGYILGASYFKPILKQYDAIIAYATNPVWLYLLGYENYIAFEHGTIRDIPYEDNEFARLMLLAYAKAKAVYVTNIDCYDSAKYIVRNSGIPVVCGLHGLDIDLMVERMESCVIEKDFGIKLGVEYGDVVFFCPSRHSWDDELKLFLKGQDKMLAAAGKLLNEFENFKIILVEFGNDVEKIKRIIENIKNLSSHIIWIKPVPKEQLYKFYSYANAVVDQFFTKSYGAITFEVLAAQSALISIESNKDYQKEFFGEELPYFSCKDEIDIYNSMKEVMVKSERYCKYISNSREWVRNHHSNQCITKALCKALSYCV